MAVLVVGGAGYIGSACCNLLLDQGRRIIALDNLSKGRREAVPDGVAFVEGDLADRNLVRDLCRKESITSAMHFAAFTQVGESVEKPDLYFENNSVKTKVLLDALLESGVKQFIFSSTAAVYGEPQNIPITEDHPRRPTNPYGWSKLFVEEMLSSYGRAYGLRYVALRYFNAAGALPNHGEDHTPETHLVPLVLQVALGKRESITIFGTDWETPDGSCVRDYIHIRDLAKAHLLALDHLEDGGPGGAFNLGNGQGHSVRELIEVARRVTGHPIPAVEGDRRPGDPARLVASSRKATEILGWKPDHPNLEDIVSTAWEWHRTHPNGYST